MLSSREIKPSSEEKRLNSVEKPKSPDTWHRICKQADQANRDTSSASSSSRDTGKRPLSDWEVKQLEEMPIGEDGKRAEKLVIPEGGLKGGMWRKLFGESDKEASTSSNSNLERDHAQISDYLEKGQYRKATELYERVVAKCGIDGYEECKIEKMLEHLIYKCLYDDSDREAENLCYVSLEKFEQKFGLYSYHTRDIIKAAVNALLNKTRRICAEELSKYYINKCEVGKPEMKIFFDDVLRLFLNKGGENEAMDLFNVTFEKYEQKFGLYNCETRCMIEGAIQIFLKEDKNSYAKELFNYYIDKCEKDSGEYTGLNSIEARCFIDSVLKDFLNNRRSKKHAIELLNRSFDKYEEKFGLESTEVKWLMKDVLEVFSKKLDNRSVNKLNENRDRKEVIELINDLVAKYKPYDYKSPDRIPSPPRRYEPSPLEVYKGLPLHRQEAIHPSRYSPERRIREDPSFVRQIEEQFLDMFNCDDE